MTVIIMTIVRTVSMMTITRMAVGIITINIMAVAWHDENKQNDS